MLAHGPSHSVPGISLPPGDANLCPHYLASWTSGVKRFLVSASQAWEGPASDDSGHAQEGVLIAQLLKYVYHVMAAYLTLGSVSCTGLCPPDSSLPARLALFALAPEPEI